VHEVGLDIRNRVEAAVSFLLEIDLEDDGTMLLCPQVRMDPVRIIFSAKAEEEKVWTIVAMNDTDSSRGCWKPKRRQ
jgi:hypothetical protein